MSMEKDEILLNGMQEQGKTDEIIPVVQDTSLEIFEVEAPVPAETEQFPQLDKKGRKKKPPGNKRFLCLLCASLPKKTKPKKINPKKKEKTKKIK